MGEFVGVGLHLDNIYLYVYTHTETDRQAARQSVVFSGRIAVEQMFSHTTFKETEKKTFSFFLLSFLLHF